LVGLVEKELQFEEQSSLKLERLVGVSVLGSMVAARLAMGVKEEPLVGLLEVESMVAIHLELQGLELEEYLLSS
jgi:hypothetical protein